MFNLFNKILLARKRMVFRPGANTSTSPVFGLRPTFDLKVFEKNDPSPLSSYRDPFFTPSTILSRIIEQQ